MRPSFRLLYFTALAALLLAGCSRKAPKATHHWFGMDTEFSATLYGRGGEVPADSAFSALSRESRRLEEVFSDYLTQSALRRLTGNTGDTLQADAEITLVFRAAEEMAQASRGSFDITLHDLKSAWGISSGDSGRVPSPPAILAAMHGNPALGAPADSNPAAYPPFRLLPGDRIVLLRDSTVFDLGGIAKGYAVDRMHGILDSLGYPDHIVSAGGDLRVGGRKGKSPWNLAIRHPRRADALAGTLTLPEPLAISTSGDYERFFIRDGIRYHHIFDPRTGRPARPYCSVTVLSPSSLLSDRLTKPLFILGPEKGAYLLKRFGARAVWMREIPATSGGDRVDAADVEPRLCYTASDGLAGVLAIREIEPCEQANAP